MLYLKMIQIDDYTSLAEYEKHKQKLQKRFELAKDIKGSQLQFYFLADRLQRRRPDVLLAPVEVLVVDLLPHVNALHDDVSVHVESVNVAVAVSELELAGQLAVHPDGEVIVGLADGHAEGGAGRELEAGGNAPPAPTRRRSRRSSRTGASRTSYLEYKWRI
ncbi:hypothetical protein NQ318_004517 [Aromia moschata]|uniref:Uncharacterized protein n=1 Tax=Aromia moschata TaxID=1265417 RepID=A0AAV8Y6C6_9CUCU|nr:hypothetical protein NQ318_004517 [Aromia moschata]